jgi:hypothetical protein
LKALRDLWLAVTGRPAESEPARPEVIVHDPGAQGPHDLDDPFHDPGVQSRMAGVIAAAKDIPPKKH